MENSSEQFKDDPKERLWSPVFIIIIVCTLCAFLVGQGSNAGTSVYLERTGGSVGLAGIGALVFSVGAAVTRIVGGPIIDTRGRAIVIVLGCIVMLVGCIGPLVNNNDAFFIVWRALQGVGFAAATTANATAAADVLPLSRLGEGIGYYGLGQALSMSVGPALAIFLVSTDSPSNFYLGLSACAALALAFSFLIRYEKHPQDLPATAEYRVRWGKHQIKEGAEDAENSEEAASTSNEMGKLRKMLDSIFEPTALPGAVPMMFIATAFGFGIFFMGVCGGALGVTNAGLFYTISAVMMIAVRLTSSKFMDKVLPIKIMGMSVLSCLVCYSIILACLLLPLGEAAEYVFYAAGVFYGLSVGVAVPINQTVAVKHTPPERWGAANGLFLLGVDVSIGISSMMWGFVIQNFGFAAAAIGVMCFVALSFFVALIFYPASAKKR